MKKCQIYIVQGALAQVKRGHHSCISGGCSVSTAQLNLEFTTNVTKNIVVTNHFKRHTETDPNPLEGYCRNILLGWWAGGGGSRRRKGRPAGAVEGVRMPRKQRSHS